MILFLDDNEARRERFRMQEPTAHFAENAFEAIALLATGDEFDEVWLDHDLGGQVYVDSNEPNTGAAVVRWIVANKPKVTRFFVHTLNYAAGCRMVDDLRDAGYSVRHSDWVLSGNK